MVRGKSVANSSSEERRIVEEIEALMEELELLKGIVLVVVNSRDVIVRLTIKIGEKFDAKLLEVKSGQEIIDTFKKRW